MVQQMKFATKITALQHREWSEYYLDYNGLKRILAEVDDPTSLLEAGDGKGSDAGTSASVSVSLVTKTHFKDEVVTSTKFLAEIYKEAQKICLFVLNEQGQIASELDECNKKLDELANICRTMDEDGDENETAQEVTQLSQKFRKLRDKYNRVGAGLLHLIQFVDLNNQGILRLLKKHDKRVRDRHNRAYELFLTGTSRYGRRSSNNSATIMSSLQHYESLDALCVTLQTGYTHLRLIQENLFGSSGSGDTSTDGSSSQGSSMRPHYAAMAPTDLERGRASIKSQTSKPKSRTRSPKGLGRRFKSNQGLAEMAQALSSAAEEYIEDEKDIHNTSSFLLVSERRFSMAVDPNESHTTEDEGEELEGTTFVLDPQDILMAEIYAARREMQGQSDDVVNMLATTALGFTPEPADIIMPGQEDWIKREYEQAAALDDYKKKSSISGVLNLVSSFIYMANYLIVVPTVVEYSNKLGADPALSSFIVGMTPFATIFSTILYSWWTSYSYRVPLLFAASLNIVGNITYAMGYPCNSMVFVLLGRLMQGLGSCRPINRRYIADAYSTAERTAASAIFVAVGSFGMALGPFLGSLLHKIAEKSDSPYWQVENAPGWFMAVVWSVYVVFHIIFFVDPPKQDDEAPSEPATSGKKAALSGESKPLLENKTLPTSVVEERRVPIWKNSAVMVNFFIYFIMKLLMECVSSSTSILTYYYFEWDGSWAGYWLAFLCFLVLPVNLVVAHLSKTYEDREMMMVMQAVTIIGCIVIMRYGDEYHLGQYMTGSLIIVVFSNMVEGPNMSLLSKTIPKAWRKGFLNVGLLATEAATLGRTVGDVWLALCGLPGLEHQLNLTLGSMIIATSFTLWISYRFYDSLVAMEDKTL
mmetsp:Transcript_42954/g.103842  ORF Transcript_42954/g.103842 Transcript_42954/m.103842 type:complete len:872 (+) Transcript_42954:141-2756(+)